MKEFEFIKYIESLIKIKPENLICGIGDDCAVISPSPEKAEIITTDAMVEGIHFLREHISPFELGAKAAATNLSDIAAMGGNPKFALVSLAIPPNCGELFITGLYKGIVETLSRYETTIIGGNTSSSLRDISINITLIGEADKKNIVFRDGAKPGDSIYVTGTLGDSAAGLEILKLSTSLDLDNTTALLVKKHISPVPRVLEAQELSNKLSITSMIDISDGLSSDLCRICNKSDVGAIIFEDFIPYSKELVEYLKKKKGSPLDYVLNGGEDYELLFTLSPLSEEKLHKVWNKGFVPVTKIGTIQKEKELVLIDKHGEKKLLNAGGYEHRIIC